MAKLKVSELTRTANVNATDLVYIVQGVNSRAATIANVFSAVSAIAGPPGPTGPAGPQGETGATGETGPAGDPASLLIEYVVSSNTEANAYYFSGFGFEDLLLTENPTFYLRRGFRYQFYNTSGDTDPLVIAESENGNIFSSLGYFAGSVFDGIQITEFTVPMHAPANLYYRSGNANSQSMGNVIYII